MFRWVLGHALCICYMYSHRIWIQSPILTGLRVWLKPVLDIVCLVQQEPNGRMSAPR